MLAQLAVRLEALWVDQAWWSVGVYTEGNSTVLSGLPVGTAGPGPASKTDWGRFDDKGHGTKMINSTSDQDSWDERDMASRDSVIEGLTKCDY